MNKISGNIMENYDSLRILFIRHAETNYAIFGV